MPHPSDQRLDDLLQLLQLSHASCIQSGMVHMAGFYDEYINALQSLRHSHSVLQEAVLARDEADELEDDDSVEALVMDFVARVKPHLE
jgi:hypothetical protein